MIFLPLILVTASATYGEKFLLDKSNICKTTSCVKISTQLLTKQELRYSPSFNHSQYSHTSNIVKQSNNFKSSWIDILRTRKRKRRKYRIVRLKRSPTRTIVSVKSDKKSRHVKSNTKCHKYARFQV